MGRKLPEGIKVWQDLDYQHMVDHGKPRLTNGLNLFKDYQEKFGDIVTPTKEEKENEEGNNLL